MTPSQASQAAQIGMRSSAQSRRPAFSISGALAPAPYFMRVPLAEIAPHPGNARIELDGLKELAASIRSTGGVLVQPVVLVTVDVYNASAEAPLLPGPGIRYVTLNGHRRCAAAAMADCSQIDAVIRQEYTGDEDELAKMAAENISRLGYTPMEEAGIIERQLRRPMSLRAVADLLGVNREFVRRRSLLNQLPDVLQRMVHAGQLRPGPAEELAALKDPELMTRAYALMTDPDAPARTATDAVATVREQDLQTENAKASQRRLDADQIPIIDPESEWGARAADRLLSHDEEPDHPSACLAASIADDGLIDWYCTDQTRHGVRDLAASARAAAKSRVESAAALGLDFKGAPAMVYVLADSILALLRPDAALRLALSWAARVTELGVTEQMAGGDLRSGLSWIEDLLSAGDAPAAKEARVRFASLATIAVEEVAARRTAWDHRQVAYLRRLSRDTGYEPTLWEREQLDGVVMMGEDVSCA